MIGTERNLHVVGPEVAELHGRTERPATPSNEST